MRPPSGAGLGFVLVLFSHALVHGFESLGFIAIAPGLVRLRLFVWWWRAGGFAVHKPVGIGTGAHFPQAMDFALLEIGDDLPAILSFCRGGRLT
jgi:hypothetical protein